MWPAALAIAVLVGHTALFVVHAQTWPAVSTVGAGDRTSWLFKTCPPVCTASMGSLTAILPLSFAAAFSHKHSLSAEFQLRNWFGDSTDLFFLSWYVMRGFRDMVNYWLSCHSSQTWHCENTSVWKNLQRVEKWSKYNSAPQFFPQMTYVLSRILFWP